MGKKGVLKKAKKLELKGIRKNKINSGRIPALEEILQDVYVICRPKPSDYFNRKDLVRIFNLIAKEIYGNSGDTPVVEEFGSFLMDIFSAKSDLDLSVNFSNKEVDFPREKKIQSLRKFAKKLYSLRRKGHISSVQPILTANVPILKIVDQGTGIECDISIENRDGLLKSQIVRMISSIDERFRMLCVLMKAWAKSHDINSSKDRTLNSLSIISLVAFHLQTRDPPILPPFSAIFKDGIDPENVEKNVNNFLDFGKRNNEFLGELFVTLLIKLASVETLWPKGLCASVYEGSWIFKKWDSTPKKKLDSKFGCISVEDFTDRSLNVARAVGKKQVEKIYKYIHLSIYYVFAFLDGHIQGTKLREFLFGRDFIAASEDQSTANVDRRTVDCHISLDPIMTKRMRTTGGFGETERSIPFNIIQTKIVHWRGPPVEGWGGNHVSMHLEQIQPSRKIVHWRGPPMEGWGGPTTRGWGGNHVSSHLEQIQSSRKIVHWRGPPVEGWGGKPESIHLEQIQPSRKIVHWRGPPVEGWLGPPVEQIHLEQFQPNRMQSTGGWGDIQQAALPDPIWTKETQSAEGWGRW